MLSASTYGYWTVGGIIALESMGLPLPGETTLIAAAVYAGTTHHLNIWLVIAAAAMGAILGDNIGFWIGREVGYRLLLRYGHYVHLTEARIKLGQYLFLRHGGKIVFFGRFIAVMRALAAVLAGANHMSWPRFLLFNAAGGFIWAALYGLAAYHVGHALEHIAKPAALGLPLLRPSLSGCCSSSCIGMKRNSCRRRNAPCQTRLSRPGGKLKNLGRVSFNPLKHIDPFGTILLPTLLLLMRSPVLFGYAKPVPVNFQALHNPEDASEIAA